MVVIYLIVVSLMVALALWQLQRADEKIDMLSAAERARQVPAVAIDTVTDPAVAAATYRRVTATGCYVQGRQFLWDNRSHDGQPGFEVITPLRLASGGLALVNRGWLPMGPTRDDLPDLQIGGKQPMCVTLEGSLTRPSRGFMSGPAVAAAGSWPRILQYFDYPALETALGEPIVPGVVQLGQSGAPSSRPEALIANWQPTASGPERHYGYAFQWFAMATALTVLFVVLNTRKAGLPIHQRDSPDSTS